MRLPCQRSCRPSRRARPWCRRSGTVRTGRPVQMCSDDPWAHPAELRCRSRSLCPGRAQRRLPAWWKQRWPRWGWSRRSREGLTRTAPCPPWSPWSVSGRRKYHCTWGRAHPAPCPVRPCTARGPLSRPGWWSPAQMPSNRRVFPEHRRRVPCSPQLPWRIQGCRTRVWIRICRFHGSWAGYRSRPAHRSRWCRASRSANPQTVPLPFRYHPVQNRNQLMRMRTSVREQASWSI